MREEITRCNLCMDDEKNVEEMIGLEYTDDCEYIKKHWADTDCHICIACLLDLKRFIAKEEK